MICGKRIKMGDRANIRRLFYKYVYGNIKFGEMRVWLIGWRWNFEMFILLVLEICTKEVRKVPNCSEFGI